MQNQAMKVAVTVLRHEGQILKNHELPPPVEGELIIGDFHPGTNKGRWMRKAELKSKQGGTVSYDALTPIFDPQIMRVDETGMYLQGFQRYPTPDDKIFEFVQVWRCVPTE